MFFRSILAVSLVFAGIGVAHAASSDSEPFPLKAESTEQFRQQAETLRMEMDKGKYAGLSRSDKKAIEKRLDQLDALYVKRSAGNKIKDDDAVALVNASSEINSLLSGNKDDQLVCQQEKILGSNRRTKVCMTVAEREARRRGDTQDMLDRRPDGIRGN